VNKHFLLVVLGLLFYVKATGQVLSGQVLDEQDKGILGVSVYPKGKTSGTVTDANGFFELAVVAAEVTVIFQHIAYHTKEAVYDFTTSQDQSTNIVLSTKTAYLDAVEVKGNLDADRLAPSLVRLKPLSVEALPSPFADFTRILATLPGVVSNNELSSTYSVRGGNFDENLVYVNGIPIYRPQLITAGRQEGLSFVNSNLVADIAFSAGGWESKYGDKLSSTLDVNYKQPDRFGASATVSLLGGQFHLENATKNQRINYLIGVRHKRAEYLLNSLETKGEYLPRFTDLQSMTTFNLGPDNDLKKTQISLLLSYARNRYEVSPASRETEFGTFNETLRLFVAFIGREVLEYDTYQGGLKLNHRFNERWSSDLTVSAVLSSEREFKDVEGGYRLCDLDTDIGSDTFNECLITRGIGTNFEYSRNILDAQIVYLENKNSYQLNQNNTIEFGAGLSVQQMDDQLNEYAFRDSSEYIISLSSAKSANRINNNQFHAFIQNTINITNQSTLNIGVRGLYTRINDQLMVSPRIQYAYKPAWDKEVLLRAAVGLYYQPPFYRELRDFEGIVYKDTKAQKSMHFILGMDHYFKIWNRDFTLFSEAYYKDISNAIPYDVDNVRIRYHPTVASSAYAAGFDMRLSGEFIPGAVSWFSLGILSTREQVEGIEEAIRRPSDQRLNVGVFFQDHLPNDPTWRVSLNLQYGTGLPFGPPDSFENRAKFNGDIYRRVDVGFVKEVNLSNTGDYPKLLIGAEILNLLGVSNTISYTWVEDVVGQQFAIPNGLSARFLNIKLTLKI
jgi:hypothetical protein